MKETAFYDIAIIGGGIAGMTAAIYAARANRSCIVLESGITGGLANATYTVENFPSYSTIHGMDLMEKVREQVDLLGVTVEEVCEIEGLDLASEIKRIETEEAVYEARAVIIATGRKPVELETDAECNEVHYCAVCDGAAYKGKHVVIAGGGNSAFDEGLYLLQLGVERLTLVEPQDRLFAAGQTRDALLRCGNAECRISTRIKDFTLENGRLKAVVLEDVNSGECSALPADGVFVFLGQTPNTELFKNIIDLDERGYVKADNGMRTNIPGVFSAGDVNAKEFRQLTTAAADGTIAALMADRHIRAVFPDCR